MTEFERLIDKQSFAVGGREPFPSYLLRYQLTLSEALNDAFESPVITREEERHLKTLYAVFMLVANEWVEDPDMAGEKPLAVWFRTIVEEGQSNE